MHRKILCQTFQVAATALLLVGCGSDSDSTTLTALIPMYGVTVSIYQSGIMQVMDAWQKNKLRPTALRRGNIMWVTVRRHDDGGREQHTEVRQVFSNQGIVTLEHPGGEELQACHFRLDEQRIHLLDAGDNESGVGYTELWVDAATGLTVKRVREFDYQGQRDALQTEELLISYHIDGVKVF